MSFSTISNEFIFFNTQGTRLGTIFAPDKDIEWALPIVKPIACTYIFVLVLQSQICIDYYTWLIILVFIWDWQIRIIFALVPSFF